MKSGNYVPDRGDVVWLNFTPQVGHEQRGKRPALILSPKIYNEKTSLCICLPITSKVKGYPFEVPLPYNLDIKGVILSDQVKNLDFSARDISFVCKVDAKVLEHVQKNVLALVGEQVGDWDDPNFPFILDTFRHMHGDVEERYSWWSYRIGARGNNVGWRIDYFYVSDDLKDKIVEADILDDIMRSDHCPVKLVLEV